MHDYVLRVGNHRLRIGSSLDVTSCDAAGPAADAWIAGPDWNLPRRALTARQIVASLDSLFEAVCLRLGPDVDRAPLLRSLAATLAIGGREACLPLAALDFADPLRRELTAQAARIGKTLADWAAEANDARAALRHHGRDPLEGLDLRSRCDGHPWTEGATSLLTGTTGGPLVMQLYNEWLHQLVLLRDALLPFENWERVPLPLPLQDGVRGLRAVEAARDGFLAEFLTRIPTHASIVGFARALFDPAGRSGAGRNDTLYGFQAESGLVLPAVVGSDDLEAAPKGLLAWHPAQVALPPKGRTLAFRYAFADYLSAPRSAIGPPMDGRLEDEASIVAEATGDDGAILWLTLNAGRHAYRVDLGQCLRGQRFGYRPIAGASTLAPHDVFRHDAGAVLGQPGLVTAEHGVHLLPTGDNALVALALLGKIYPENTVLAGRSAWRDVLAAGKGYGAKFVVGIPL